MGDDGTFTVTWTPESPGRHQLRALVTGASTADKGSARVSSAVRKVTVYRRLMATWYGPGFYGNGGACGMLGPNGLTKETVGVAHRTLPCGTVVTFRYLGRTVTTRVIDRGPYVAGRTWDMTHGLCELLNHCFTGGGVYWKLGG